MLGTILLYTPRKGLGRLFLAIIIIIWLTIIIFPVHVLIATPLESRFPQVTTLPKKVDGIVVLGGAVDEMLTAMHKQVSLNQAAERMTVAATLSKKYPNARLIFTGGSGLTSKGNLELNEATVAELFFASLGISESQLILENNSRNTYENALYSKQLAQSKLSETWLLVTSAYHMPRAIGTFRKQGWQVIPYPVDYRTTGNVTKRHLVLLLGDKLSIIDTAAKEWVGLVAYWLLGRSEEIFPSP